MQSKREYDQARYAIRKDEIKRKVSEWRRANPEKHRASVNARRAANPDKAREWNKKYESKNRARLNEKTARRRVSHRKARVKWAMQSEIDKFYTSAKLLTELFGIQHQVDHIVPLQSKIVCGLHCEANLRICMDFENQSKGNRHWPDMP